MVVGQGRLASDAGKSRGPFRGGGDPGGAPLLRFALADLPGTSRIALYGERDEFPAALWSWQSTPHVKDGINDYIVNGVRHAVNPLPEGTKAAASYRAAIPPGQSAIFRLRFTDEHPSQDVLNDGFDRVFEERLAEANEFYSKIISSSLSADAQNVFRQAMGGMFWSKQFYHYDVRTWLEGDPTVRPLLPQRWMERNHSWVGGFFGWKSLIFILLVSSFTGAVVGITAMIIKGKDMKYAVPFGPFLSAAAIAYIFWGDVFMRVLLSRY